MKKSTALIALALCSALLSAVAAPQADAHRRGTRGTTPVTCGQVITTSIRVGNDLYGCDGDGLVVGASGITIDLNGHTIDGRRPSDYLGGNGIVVRAPHRDVTIKNGRVQGFAWGIELNGANGGVTGVTVKNMLVTENNIGIEIEFADDNEVRGVHLVDNRDATIRVEYSTGNTIRRNRISGGRWGVEVGNDARFNRVVDNVIVGGDGSFNSGVVVWERAVGTKVARNRIRGYDLHGIELTGGAVGTNVIGNRVTRNDTNGISVDSTIGTTLERNRASRNAVDGIQITGQIVVTTMARNVATYNGRWGIALFPDPLAVAEPSGNRAWGNGEPEQCLNIECRTPRRHHGKH